MTKYDLEERLITFAVEIIRLANTFKRSEASVILRRQILRSGTSVALNYGESRGAESKRDLIHKLQIVLKELRETHISLRIISKAGLTMKANDAKVLINECDELIAIMVTSLKRLKNGSK